MKRFIKILLFFLGTFLVISCSKISPSGEVEVKDVSVENFNKINFKGNFKVFFARGKQNLVSVETYPNIYKNLDIKVENGTLFIEENSTPENVDFYNITIFGKNEITSVSLGKHVEMNISGQIKIPQFKLQLQDQSKFMGAVIAEKSTIEMSQKSNANLLGETKSLNLKLADSASIMAPYFYVDNLDLKAKNDASAGLYIDQKISGIIENTSKLIYFGEPLNKLSKKDKASVENRKLP